MYFGLRANVNKGWACLFIRWNRVVDRCVYTPWEQLVWWRGRARGGGGVMNLSSPYLFCRVVSVRLRPARTTCTTTYPQRLKRPPPLFHPTLATNNQTPKRGTLSGGGAAGAGTLTESIVGMYVPTPADLALRAAAAGLVASVLGRVKEFTTLFAQVKKLGRLLGRIPEGVAKVLSALCLNS